MKFLRWLDNNLEEAVVVVLFLAILAIGSEQVITRYTMRFVHSWAEEFMRICFVALSLFSFSLCAKRLQHVRVEMLLSVLPPAAGKAVKIFSSFVFFLFCILTTKYAWDIMLLQYKNHQVTAAMGLPTWSYFILGPFCFVLMAFRILQKELFPLFISGRKNKPEDRS